jgi:acid phosphatase
MRKLLLGLFAVLLLSNPLWAQNAGVVTPPEQLPNLGLVKQQIKKYYACDCTCGCYEKELEQQAARAITFLRERVAHRQPDEKLAIVLDIDDTALSNYPFYLKTDFGHESARFNEWAASAAAPAIKPTLQVFNVARELGVAVFFLSGRPDTQRDITEKNLAAAGYHDWAGLIMRAPQDIGKTAADYKSAARARLVQQGYRLALNVGDQMSDLTGDPAAELSVKLPNPMYVIP